MPQDPGSVSLDQPTLIIAAGDESFRLFLEYTIRNEGLAVVGVSDGTALIKRLQRQKPGVLLLDAGLPGIQIDAFCAGLRLNPVTREIPVIVLANGKTGDGQHATEAGSEIYLDRPFSPEQLMASIGTAWHQAQRTASAQRALLSFLDLELDLTSYRVRRDGRMIHLAPTEFRLLHQLMKHPGKVYSREELQSGAWPRAVHLGPRTVDVHIGRLRAALNETGGQDLIRTVRSVGYSLSD